LTEPLDLDAIGKACDEASPGPWEVERAGYEGDAISSITQSPNARRGIVGGDGGCICSDADGHFIANARSWVPALVARVRELEEQLAAMEDEHRCCSGAVLVAQRKERGP
jgi:hypothetical protein